MRDYQLATCPNCEASSLSCELCHGLGVVSWSLFWDYIDCLTERPAPEWLEAIAAAELADLAECGAVGV